VIVLFFGRLVLEKGVETYVSVVRALHARAPVKALVVGAGPAAEMFADLPGAVLTGHLEGEGLARAVASADIMLNPSTTEAFGNVILEAMASGLPVVSADAANARALLREGETGLLCPPDDVAAYAAAIAKLASSADLRAKMGRAAREASAAYSWDAASESVVQVYRALAAKAK
jgi:glycosyltransferase involved in cell wall biosynthesis